MTPEERLDRMDERQDADEREFREKINILADSQSRADADHREIRDKLKALADSQTRSNAEIGDKLKALADSQSRADAEQREIRDKLNILLDALFQTNLAVNRLIDSQVEMVANQKKTDDTLQAFIRSLRKGSNGSE